MSDFKVTVKSEELLKNIYHKIMSDSNSADFTLTLKSDDMSSELGIKENEFLMCIEYLENGNMFNDINRKYRDNYTEIDIDLSNKALSYIERNN